MTVYLEVYTLSLIIEILGYRIGEKGKLCFSKVK